MSTVFHHQNLRQLCALRQLQTIFFIFTPSPPHCQKQLGPPYVESSLTLPPPSPTTAKLSSTRILKSHYVICFADGLTVSIFCLLYDRAELLAIATATIYYRQRRDFFFSFKGWSTGTVLEGRRGVFGGKTQQYFVKKEKKKKSKKWVHTGKSRWCEFGLSWNMFSSIGTSGFTILIGILYCDLFEVYQKRLENAIKQALSEHLCKHCLPRWWKNRNY